MIRHVLKSACVRSTISALLRGSDVPPASRSSARAVAARAQKSARARSRSARCANLRVRCRVRVRAQDTRSKRDPISRSGAQQAAQEPATRQTDDRSTRSAESRWRHVNGGACGGASKNGRQTPAKVQVTPLTAASRRERCAARQPVRWRAAVRQKYAQARCLMLYLTMRSGSGVSRSTIERASEAMRNAEACRQEDVAPARLPFRRPRPRLSRCAPFAQRQHADAARLVVATQEVAARCCRRHE